MAIPKIIHKFTFVVRRSKSTSGTPLLSLSIAITPPTHGSLVRSGALRRPAVSCHGFIVSSVIVRNAPRVISA